jgi:hypothetical protein
MAQTTVDCCNSALQKVGAARILSLDDNSAEARQCTITYDSNRRAELRKYRWNFAVRRVVLAPDSEAPAFEFGYQFTIPPDCLRIILPREAQLDWAIEGRKILTNSGATLNLRYVADVTDVTQWDAAFYDMVAIAMAIDMCESITNSTSKKTALERAYSEALASAKLANSFEASPADPADDDWLLAHRVSGFSLIR